MNLERLLQMLSYPAGLHADWRPAADIYRLEAGWLLKFDLAGVEPEDVEVSVSGHCLTVRGRRRDSHLAGTRHVYAMEIAYSSFERKIELPSDVTAVQVQTEFHNGMLLVRLFQGEGEA